MTQTLQKGRGLREQHGTRPLVEPVIAGRGQKLATVGEASHQQAEPAEVEHGVLVRDHLGQSGPRLLGFELPGRHHDHEPERWVQA